MGDSVHYSLRRLENLQSSVGVDGGGGAMSGKPPVVPGKEGGARDATLDTSGMSPYEAAQFKLADRMRVMRQMVTTIDELPAGCNPTKRIELSNRLRKEEQAGKAELQETRILASSENRRDDFATLTEYFKSTQRLIRARYGGGLGMNNTSAEYVDPNGSMGESDIAGAAASAVFKPQTLTDLFPGGSNSDITKPDMQPQSPESKPYNFREDEEFAQFFVQVQQNDREIDEALDRIHSGVVRLHDNATGIRYELQVQEKMLEETEVKVEHVHGRLSKLNKKLRKTLKDLDRSSLIIYFFCCLIVLGLIGVIIYLGRM